MADRPLSDFWTQPCNFDGVLLTHTGYVHVHNAAKILVQQDSSEHQKSCFLSRNFWEKIQPLFLKDPKRISNNCHKITNRHFLTIPHKHTKTNVLHTNQKSTQKNQDWQNKTKNEIFYIEFKIGLKRKRNQRENDFNFSKKYFVFVKL